MIRERLLTWIQHAVIACTFFVICYLMGVEPIHAWIAFSFIWTFLSIYYFFVEPIHSGIWIYRRLERARTKDAWFFCHIVVCGAWYLSLMLLWGVISGRELPWEGAHFLLCGGFAIGLNSLIVGFGPLVGQDRQAPWFITMFLMPLIVPLMLLFLKCWDVPAMASEWKMFTSLGLAFGLIGYGLFLMSDSMVTDA